MTDGTPGFEADCPRCDTPIDGTEDACPDCGLQFIDEDGGLSQEAVDEMLSDADLPSPEEFSPARVGAPQSLRLFVALAITLPLAPVIVFVVVSVFPIGGLLTALVFLAGWTVPAYGLARSPVPTLIVANGLGVLGLTMATAPMLIVGGRALAGTDATQIGALGSNVFAAQGVFLVIGIAVLGIAVIVRRHALATQARWEEEAEAPPGNEL